MILHIFILKTIFCLLLVRVAFNFAFLSAGLVVSELALMEVIDSFRVLYLPIV